jgi:hypothetical protein
MDTIECAAERTRQGQHAASYVDSTAAAATAVAAVVVLLD